MKYLLKGFILSIIVLYLNSCDQKPIKHQNIYQLIERILPGKSSHFIVKDLKSNNGTEAFQLSSKDGKIVIKGTNDIALAKAFNYYLVNYCNLRVSWYKDDLLIVPDELPVVDTTIMRECRFEKRFFPELLHFWLYHALVAMG